MRENAILISAIVENQSVGKLVECADYQQRLHQNLIFLATIADAQSRPVASGDVPAASTPSSPGLSKVEVVGPVGAHMSPWSAEEQQRFIAGMRRFGAYDLPNVATYIGTRSAEEVTLYFRQLMQQNQLNLERQMHYRDHHQIPRSQPPLAQFHSLPAENSSAAQPLLNPPLDLTNPSSQPSTSLHP